uniref:Vitellogenin receptor n=1 Tax=Locusta migratoria TaxID=7004 RepID=A0A6B7HKU0_LOCMI|nr:vitellogenin receptor [Locusta migratoria]
MSCGPGGRTRVAAAFLLLVGVAEVLGRCPAGFWECSGGACIREARRCDRRKDCPDGADELHCDNVNCEAPLHWMCEDGRCIQTKLKCDGNNDCGDWSDEKDCNATKVSGVQMPCSEEDFPCGDGTCIPDSWVCDGLKDCQNGNDEVLGCSKKLDCGDDFLCSNHHCIPKAWECDGNDDCGDNSDEVNCKTKDVTEGCTLDKNLFGCHDKLKCVEVGEVCDGTPHCLDGSDEGPMCQKSKALCPSQGCSFKCQPTPAGPICLCPMGFNLVNEKYCADIDECKMYGICSQKCRNSHGSYECYCDEGYTLQSDNHTCTVSEGEAVLLFSTLTEVRAFFMLSQVYRLVADGLQHVAGVAYDGLYVYWTSVLDGEEAVVRSNRDGSVTDVLVSSGLSLPEDLALDLVTGNIYFTDGEESYIGVCTKTGTECTVLVNEDVRKPRGIALLTRNGTMYWSDWGEKPKIAMAGMDGSSPRPFLVGVHWPNGITIDLGNERLYWVDAKLKSIESVNLDGTDRRVILETSVKHPFSTAVLENTLYWSDWEDRQVASCHKFTGKDYKVLVRSLKNHIYGIKVYHPALHPSMENPCRDAGCSDICMLAPNNSYTCACPADKELGFDQHTCRAVLKKEVVVAVAGSRIIEVEHRLLGRQTQAVMQASTVGHVDAVVYSSVDDMLIMSDSEEKKLLSMAMTTRVIRPLLEKGIGKITSLSYDPYGNNVYWTDAELATVEAMSMNTKTVAVLVRSTGAEPPLSVVVVPDQGHMFVAFGSSSGVHVDKILMDGSGQRVHVLEEVSGPYVSLWYDSSLDRVFMVDSNTNAIISLASDGFEHHEFKRLSGSPASVVALGQDLFWTIHGQHSLYWANKFDADSKVKKTDLMTADDVYHIVLTVVRGVSLMPNRPCHQSNGGCSHLCLMRGQKQVCGCPEGTVLQGNATCLGAAACSAGEFRCQGGRRCIPSSHRCNGVSDCPSGEDEKNCAVCREHEFGCSNGQCVSPEGRCDGIVQCSDGSDERDCEVGACDADTDFECHNGGCIAKSLRCDLTDDCHDGSDEENCDKAQCGESEFRCHSGACIPDTWECDGEVNCPDSTDEHDNCTSAGCGPDEFSCGNGHCVDVQLVCDGADDCGDDSDERGCRGSAVSDESATCSGVEFSCWSRQGVCVPLDKKCDGKADCPKAEDERECACAADEFECKNGKCVSTSWLCDQKDDCGDGSDEDPSRCVRLHEVAEEMAVCKGFECDGGKCLEWEQLCDGNRDCKDGSDEGGKCGKACVAHPCEGQCRATPAGPQCYCAAGYDLGRDGTSCRDVDECRARPPVCSQVCDNAPGGFSCGCVTGFVRRRDRVSCKATGSAMEYVLVTGGGQIRKVSQSLGSVDVVYKQDLVRVTGLDVDARENAVCWSTRETEAIYCQSLKTHNTTYVEGVGNPTEVAVDWISKNIYYVNDVPAGQSKIQVCNLREVLCAVVVAAERGSRIGNIAVDPLAGFVFWTEMSTLTEKEVGSIWRADLAGGGKKAVAQSGLGSLSGLAADTVRRVVYWADASAQVVESATYDGEQRTVEFTSEVRRPKRLVLFEDELYWLQEHSGFVMRCRLFAEGRRCRAVHINVYDGDYLTVLQESRQRPGVNPCERHRCSHTCAITPRGAKCLCADGQVVGQNVRCKNEGRKVSEPQFFIPGVVGGLKTTTAAAGRPGAESEGAGSWSVVVVLVIVVAVAVSVYYIYRRQLGSLHNLDLRIRFQKTGSSGTKQPASTSKGSRASQLAEQGFVNPLDLTRGMSISDSAVAESSFPQPLKKIRAPSKVETSDSESELDFPVSGKVDKMRLLP